MSKSILFMTRGDHWLENILPVIEQFQGDANIDPIILALPSAMPRLRRLGISHISFANLLTEGDREAGQVGRDLYARLDKPDWPEKETVAFLGLCFNELSQSTGIDAAHSAFQQKGISAFVPREVVARAISKYSAQMVVSTSNAGPEEALILQAKKQGIPAVCLFVDMEQSHIDERLHSDQFATAVTVFAEFVKSKLIKAGRTEAEVQVTGNPMYDFLSQLTPTSKINDQKEDRGWRGKKVFSYFRATEQGFSESQKLIEDNLQQIAVSNPKIQFVLALNEQCPEVPGKLPANVSLFRPDENVKDLLQMSDAVGSLTADNIIEAALLGKPSVYFKLDQDPSHFALEEEKLCLAIHHIDDFHNALQSLLSGSFKPATLPAPGTSAKSVAELIRRLVQ